MSIDSPGLQLSRLAPARKQLLKDLADELLAGARHGRLLIAVDGPTAAGKTTFADELALALRDDGATVFRASLDDFLLPRARRYARGRSSAQGRYEDSYDYSLFRRVLVDPFLMAGSAGHSDIPLDATGSGLMALLMTMLAQTVGFPVPEGGAGQLTRAMARRLEALGGEIRCNARVEAIKAVREAAE